MKEINSKFENWEIYLTKFMGGKMYSLDIGANTGEITCWMLKNLCMNSYSKVYSIDMWKECQKCGDKIEREFNENVLKTDELGQNVKMKSNINNALIKLKETGVIIFDFIYINKQNDFSNIFSNIVIAWEILNEEGIMIIDNSKNDEINDEDSSKIKTAINTFISINKLQLEILESGEYYIIKKLNQRYTHSQIVEYDNLYEEINSFKNNFFNDVVFDFIIDEDLELELKIIPEIKTVIPTINKDGISNYNLLPLIYDMKNQHNIIKFYSNLINKYSIIKDNKYNIISVSYTHLTLPTSDLV